MKIFLFSLLLLTPLAIFANAGSPLIWFNLFHLVFINAIIGIAESMVMTHYKHPNRPWLIILGNYVSMIVGFYVVIPLLVVTSPQERNMWEGGFENLLVGLLVSFLVTLVIEYPFFTAALRDKTQKKTVFEPYIKSNIITNSSMFLLYLLFAA